jgi:hypothetical protein
LNGILQARAFSARKFAASTHTAESRKHPRRRRGQGLHDSIMLEIFNFVPWPAKHVTCCRNELPQANLRCGSQKATDAAIALTIRHGDGNLQTSKEFRSAGPIVGV